MDINLVLRRRNQLGNRLTPLKNFRRVKNKDLSRIFRVEIHMPCLYAQSSIGEISRLRHYVSLALKLGPCKIRDIIMGQP